MRFLPILAVLAVAAPAAAQEQKTFRDWIVTCDNIRACTAQSLPAEDAEDRAWLRLDRDAGDAPARLSLRLRTSKLPKESAAEFALDGAPFPAAGRKVTIRSVDGETAEFDFEPDDVETLIAGARKAAALQVKIGQRTIPASLSGSVAALLFVDEKQGRLGATSALIRRGARTDVPPAPAPPIVTARGSQAPALAEARAKALTSGLRARLKKSDPDACEDRPDGFTDSDAAWPLDGGATLIGLSCSFGAYNVATGLWIVPGTDVAKARKALLPQIDGKPDNTVVNGDFDPKSGELTYFAKGRGIGDCGATGGYAWTGRKFVMTRLESMGECRGIPMDDWPTLYRSRVIAGR